MSLKKLPLCRCLEHRLHLYLSHLHVFTYNIFSSSELSSLLHLGDAWYCIFFSCIIMKTIYECYFHSVSDPSFILHFHTLTQYVLYCLWSCSTYSTFFRRLSSKIVFRTPLLFRKCFWNQHLLNYVIPGFPNSLSFLISYSLLVYHKCPFIYQSLYFLAFVSAPLRKTKLAIRQLIKMLFIEPDINCLKNTSAAFFICFRFIVFIVLNFKFEFSWKIAL